MVLSSLEITGLHISLIHLSVFVVLYNSACTAQLLERLGDWICNQLVTGLNPG